MAVRILAQVVIRVNGTKIGMVPSMDENLRVQYVRTLAYGTCTAGEYNRYLCERRTLGVGMLSSEFSKGKVFSQVQLYNVEKRPKLYVQKYLEVQYSSKKVISKVLL